jgi:hypothetical protein
MYQATDFPHFFFVASGETVALLIHFVFQAQLQTPPQTLNKARNSQKVLFVSDLLQLVHQGTLFSEF